MSGKSGTNVREQIGTERMVTMQSGSLSGVYTACKRGTACGWGLGNTDWQGQATGLVGEYQTMRLPEVAFRPR